MRVGDIDLDVRNGLHHELQTFVGVLAGRAVELLLLTVALDLLAAVSDLEEADGGG